MKQSEREDAEVTRMSAWMLTRADELADEMAQQIRSAVPVYRNDAVITATELRRTCRENVDFVFGSMTVEASPPLASPESQENGRRRAIAGVPLTSVMDAYRISARFLWKQLAEYSALGQVSTEGALRAASHMWLVLDVYTQEMAEGYRAEMASQILSQEVRRLAVFQALLEGRLPDGDTWNAALVLGLPADGPYVVVAADSMHALSQPQDALRRLGIASAWAVVQGSEVGVARLPSGPSRTDDLVRALEDAGEGRMGISPAFNDLRRTADSFALARTALAGSYTARRTTVFDRDPLAIAATSNPQIMRIVARSVLGPLDQESDRDRALLLGTFGAWLDAGGSADRAAATLFCHPNTVRHRLRRIEERTGRSLSDPRALAELTIAYETDLRADIPSEERPAHGTAS